MPRVCILTRVCPGMSELGGSDQAIVMLRALLYDELSDKLLRVQRGTFARVIWLTRGTRNNCSGTLAGRRESSWRAGRGDSAGETSSQEPRPPSQEPRPPSQEPRRVESGSPPGRVRNQDPRVRNLAGSREEPGHPSQEPGHPRSAQAGAPWSGPKRPGPRRSAQERYGTPRTAQERPGAFSAA